MAVLPDGGIVAFLDCHTSCGRCICLVSCSNSLIKRWLVRRSFSISFVLLCIVSSALAGGRLSVLP